MDPLIKHFALRKPRPQSSGVNLTITVVTALLVAGAMLGLASIVGNALSFYAATASVDVPLGQRLSMQYTGLTKIFDRNGEPLGVLSNPNSPLAAPVPLESVSPHLVSATISTEDKSFWEHEGVDLRGLLRAAWSNFSGGEATTGGSTITQQLVKTAYFLTDCEEINGLTHCSAPRTIDRKLREMAVAIDTEGQYTKEQILEWYLNSISYGGRYVGVEAGARGYFNKPASDRALRTPSGQPRGQVAALRVNRQS